MGQVLVQLDAEYFENIGVSGRNALLIISVIYIVIVYAINMDTFRDIFRFLRLRCESKI